MVEFKRASFPLAAPGHSAKDIYVRLSVAAILMLAFTSGSKVVAIHVDFTSESREASQPKSSQVIVCNSLCKGDSRCLKQIATFAMAHSAKCLSGYLQRIRSPQTFSDQRPLIKSMFHLR